MSRIGDDDALDRIGVISGAAQDGGAMVNAHDACKVVEPVPGHGYDGQ